MNLWKLHSRVGLRPSYRYLYALVSTLDVPFGGEDG